MALNGSGVYSAPAGGSYPASGTTLIESGKFNTLLADIITVLSTALYKDGQQVATQRIPFAQGVQTDSVTELTSAAGVTLDSVLLKDGRIDTTQGADIASAGTVNLETATGNVVDVTGTTGITAITLSQGHFRIVRFTGALTLTNGASLVLPGAANITTAAGDYGLFAGYASSVVRCAGFWRASGEPIAPYVDTNPIVKGSADATKKVRLEVDGLTTATTRVITVPDVDLTLPYKPGAYGSVQLFTATGTWTKPAGLVRIKVTVVAAGGAGGGNALTGASQFRGSAGGSAGGAAIKTIEAASLGATETVTIGAGGTGVSAASGNAGGNSSFGTHCSATGGSGGGGGSGATSDTSFNGDGGIGSSGTVNLRGAQGGVGAWSTNLFSVWGVGGASILGGSIGSGNADGYGAGGAGRFQGANAAAQTGFNGAPGVVIVEEFF